MFLLVQWLQVVEITKGSKVKYELDKKTGLIKVQTNCLVTGMEALTIVA